MQSHFHQVWGARSGWQKAVRRRDIGLAKKCVTLLWDAVDGKGKSHRDWLLIRIPAVIGEDCWQFAGEYAKYEKELTPENLKEKTLQFVYRLVAYPKNKDTEGLLYSTMYAEKWKLKYPYHKEMLCLAEVLKLSGMRGGKIEGFRLETDIRPICLEQFPRDLTAYEEEAVKVMMARATTSRFTGFWDNRMCCIASIILIYSRGLPELTKDVYAKAVADVIKEPLKKYDDLPLYCFDMHTRVGKMALGAVLNKKNPENLTREQISKMQFHCDSVKFWEGKRAPEHFDWWQFFRERSLAERFGSAERMYQLWANTYQMQVYHMIKWALTK